MDIYCLVIVWTFFGHGYILFGQCFGYGFKCIHCSTGFTVFSNVWLARANVIKMNYRVPLSSSLKINCFGYLNSIARVSD